jgi:hypothetical protein
VNMNMTNEMTSENLVNIEDQIMNLANKLWIYLSSI